MKRAESDNIEQNSHNHIQISEEMKERLNAALGDELYNSLMGELFGPVEDYDNDTYIMDDCIYKLAEQGETELVVYLMDLKDTQGKPLFRGYNQYGYDNQVSIGAIKNGHLDVVKCIISLNNEEGNKLGQLVGEYEAYDCKELDMRYAAYIVDQCVLAAENGHHHIVKYLATLDLKYPTLEDRMKEDAPALDRYYEDYRLNALSMLNVSFKKQVPGFLGAERHAAVDDGKAVAALETYLDKEKSLLNAAGLNSPYDVYSVRYWAGRNWDAYSAPEFVELHCCLSLPDLSRPQQRQGLFLPRACQEILAAMYLGTTTHILEIAKVFKMPRNPKIETIKIDGIEKMSFESQRHIAMLKKAVLAKQQVSRQS